MYALPTTARRGQDISAFRSSESPRHSIVLPGPRRATRRKKCHVERRGRYVTRELIARADARRREQNLERDRASTHRPITADELPVLERLGADIRERRVAAGLTIYDLGKLARRDPSFISRIERGARRARMETLRALADGFQAAGVGSSSGLLAYWLTIAEPAPPSVWPGWSEKLEKRRQTRRLMRERRTP